jgi:hypothetical protein
MDCIVFRTAPAAQIGSPHEWRSRGDTREFLPNLKSLRWSYQCLCLAADIKTLPLFFSSSLVSLDLDVRNIWSSAHHGIMSLLSDAICRASFHIVDLTIRGVSLSEPPETGTIHHKFLSSILSFGSTLKRLRIDPRLLLAIRQYYPTFSQLESLALELWSNSQDMFDQLDFSAHKPMWKRLRELSGRCGAEEIRGVWVPLIHHMGKSVRKIAFHNSAADSNNTRIRATDHQLLFSVIGDSCPALESITVIGMDCHDYAFDSRMLRPLYKCSRLSEITLWTSHVWQDISLCLEDSDIVELARAFEHMRILHIGSDSPSWATRSPRLTLNVIRTLATSCPQLQHLTLTIDATAIPPVSEPPGLRPSSIQTLNFGYSQIDSPREVAEYLGHVCSASGIRSAECVMPEWRPLAEGLKKIRAGWIEVAGYMKSIQGSGATARSV